MSTQSRGAGAPEWNLTDRLRKALKAAGVSVQAMADHLEVNRKTVGNYLNGRTKPTTATLRTWALRCGVSFGWLRDGVEDGPTSIEGQELSPTRWLHGRVVDIRERRRRPDRRKAA